MSYQDFKGLNINNYSNHNIRQVLNHLQVAFKDLKVHQDISNSSITNIIKFINLFKVKVKLTFLFNLMVSDFKVKYNFSYQYKDSLKVQNYYSLITDNYNLIKFKVKLIKQHFKN